MAKVTSTQVGEYLKIGLYVGGGFLAYKAIKNLAETFGLVKTEQEQQVDTATDQASGSTVQTPEKPNPFLAFNPTYAKALVEAYRKKYGNTWNNKAQLKIASKDYLKLAKLLNDSKGFFNDDEDKLYSVFRLIQTQFQLSSLSIIFNFYYKKDLLEYLKSFLSAEEIAPILNQVKNYPQYFK
jgi:hypothetical protein